MNSERIFAEATHRSFPEQPHGGLRITCRTNSTPAFKTPGDHRKEDVWWILLPVERKRAYRSLE